MQPGKPRVWTVFSAYALVIVLALGLGPIVVAVGLIVLDPQGLAQAAGRPGPASIARLQELMQRPGLVVAAAAINALVLLVVALSAAALSPEPVRERLRFTRPKIPPVAITLAAVAFFALSSAFDGLLALVGLEDTGSLGFLARAVQGATGGALALLVLAVGAGAGVAEELFFRGYVQKRLVARWGPRAGVAVTAVLFGLIHFDLLHSAFALVGGLYLGWIAERAGSVWPSAVAHTLNNAAWTLGVALLPRVRGASVGGAVLLLGLIVGVISTWKLVRTLEASTQRS